MLTRRDFVNTAIATAAGVSSQAYAQQSLRMTIGGGHPTALFWVKTIEDVFIPQADEYLKNAGGKYKFAWNKAFGGTLVKLGQESQGMRDQLLDVGIVYTVFETAQFPLNNVCLYAPFSMSDIGHTIDIYNKINASIPEVGNEWTSRGLVRMAGCAMESYQLFTNKPIKVAKDLNGLKIVAPGAYGNWVKNTGAVPVSGNLNTYYEDIKSGVANGTVSLPTGVAAIKLQEVAPYLTKIDLGTVFVGFICVRKNLFDKLPPEAQDALRRAGADYEREYAKRLTVKTTEVMNNWDSMGGKRYDMLESDRRDWINMLPPLGVNWAEDMEKKGLPGKKVMTGYMNAIKATGTKLERDWSIK